MKQTGLRMAIGSLLGWSRMTDKRRRKKVKQSMEQNKQIQKITIEVKME